MTIRDLSADTGLSVTAIGNLEADKFNAVLPNLRALANALGVPVAYLGCFERLPESTLGQRITKARMYHGFTKDEMARVIGVDPKTLRLWEQDKHQPLQRYSTVLNTYMAILDE